MITDQETNFVYFSEIFKQNFETEYSEITSILAKHGVGFNTLTETKDIWCRDYMPIQISETEFVEYRYDPDYLQTKKYRKIKTYPDLVCDKIGLKTIKSDLIIDGGNIVKSRNEIILTDKVLSENKDFYTPTQLLEILKSTFKIDRITLIPWDKEDEIEYFGHSDGMVRFINENTVLINGYFKEYSEKFKDHFFGELDKSGLEFIELNFNVKTPNESFNWGYINFLQTKNVIIIPQFGIEEDGQAFEQFVKIFPDYAKKDRIEKINAERIIEGGGVLNCMTWNIKR
jgi:agmatine/peptidylarginine deiminase